MSSRRLALETLAVDAGTHPGLWLDKALPKVEEGNQGHQAHFDDLLNKISVAADYRRFFQRWRDSVQVLEPCTRTAEITVQGRMVVGLGAESVLETSIALHRTYGAPYIPGSALKGLAAAAAHKRLENPAWNKTAKDGKIGACHQILFGDQESAGYVTFHDALWIPNGDKLPLDLDVMTVHHPDYYQGKTDAPPADWDSPTPVAFLTARGRYLLALTGPEEWADAALEILLEALHHDGIGAKTAAGYGRMSAPSKPKPESIPWELRIKGLHMGNAETVVPGVLAPLRGSARRQAADAIIARLGRRDLNKKKERDWVQQLLAAAELT